MKNIALKRAKHCPPVKDSLHPEFICEYADTSLFPVGFHKAEDGYEILDEEQFEAELAKNELLHEEFLARRRKAELDAIAAKEAAAIVQENEDRKARIEYEQFLEWKAMRKNSGN